MNESPVGFQSRAVTEPQRDKVARPKGETEGECAQSEYRKCLVSAIARLIAALLHPLARELPPGGSLTKALLAVILLCRGGAYGLTKSRRITLLCLFAKAAHYTVGALLQPRP